MRLWSIHPKYLDSRGLVALWREALLARKVLQGKTKGYRFHPQLVRFRKCRNPVAVMDYYLFVVFKEAERRNYRFSRAKIGKISRSRVKVTSGQLRHEFMHLKRKLFRRDRKRFRELAGIRRIVPHPLFSRKRGGVEPWEKSYDA